MGQQQTKKKAPTHSVDSSEKQLINNEDSPIQETSLDIVDCFDLLDEKISIEKYILDGDYWSNIELNDSKTKELDDIAKEMSQIDIKFPTKDIKKCIQDVYLFLKDNELTAFKQAIGKILLNANILIQVGKNGFGLFQDIMNQVNQETYTKRMENIHNDWKAYFDNVEYISSLQESMVHIENIMKAKAKKYFWATVILGVVSLISFVGLGIAAITTFIGAFVGVPIVAGVGVAMAVGCSVAIPFLVNSSLSCGETSMVSDKWEGKLNNCGNCLNQIQESADYKEAESTSNNYEYTKKLPTIEECEKLITIFIRLSQFGTELRECII